MNQNQSNDTVVVDRSFELFSHFVTRNIIPFSEIQTAGQSQLFQWFGRVSLDLSQIWQQAVSSSQITQGAQTQTMTRRPGYQAA